MFVPMSMHIDLTLCEMKQGKILSCSGFKVNRGIVLRLLFTLLSPARFLGRRQLLTL